MTPNEIFSSPDAVQQALSGEAYLASRALALSLKLAHDLGKPLLLEGEAGVGKTEIAKVLASLLDTPLVRLQCYEGLDASSALYEWNYARQILHIRIAEQDPAACAKLEESIFSDDFLLARPLLAALRHPGPRPAVLLIDEVDRADEEFEAFLLEILSDFQITIPELGVIRASHPPLVVLTSNRTRELHDALKRRCLYLWVDYPSPTTEREIILRRVPGIGVTLAEAITRTVNTLRAVDFYKRPGVAETLDWSRALFGLGVDNLTPDLLADTAGVLLKYRDDIDRLRKLDPARILEGDPGLTQSSERR